MGCAASAKTQPTLEAEKRRRRCRLVKMLGRSRKSRRNNAQKRDPRGSTARATEEEVDSKTTRAPTGEMERDNIGSSRARK